MNVSDSHDAVGIDVRWTDRPQASESGHRYSCAEWFVVWPKKGRELGYAEITEEILDQFKNQMMGRMGGESGMADAAEQMEQGHLPWTAAAKERLNTVPEFMRRHDQANCRRDRQGTGPSRGECRTLRKGGSAGRPP